MSGLTALVDTLLATRLAQRLDLVPLKPAGEIAGPGAVGEVEAVANDVRLASRAGVEAQLGPGALRADQRGHAAAQGGAGPAVILSPAARALTALLDSPDGPPPKVIGTQPLLAASPFMAQTVPATAALAEALAQTVGDSGLFYESHLARHAAGARPLADMLREPQAGLQAPLPGQAPAVDGAAAQAGPTGTAALPESGSPGAQPEGQAHGTAAQGGDSPAAAQGAHQPPSLDAPEAVRTPPAHFPGVHADAAALVRQQLELLAEPVFRWSGQAWPGVPADWEIHEEQGERPAPEAGEAPVRTWSTRLALTLPMLKEVEVRISLTGSALRLHLAACEGSTRQLLSQSGNELPVRLGALGLQLTDLQVGAMPVAPAPGGISHGIDAA